VFEEKGKGGITKFVAFCRTIFVILHILHALWCALCEARGDALLHLEMSGLESGSLVSRVRILAQFRKCPAIPNLL
jgi:hypothetical protein